MNDFKYPNCHGVHDWSNPFTMMNDYDIYVRCQSCGILQRYYVNNMVPVMIKGGIDLIQLHQQNFNMRPFKPFFDVK